MISVDYVNNGGGAFLYSDPISTFERYMESCMDDINKDYDEYRSKTGWILFESTIMDEMSSDDKMFVEAEGKSILAKIGDKIIEIGKEFVKMIDAMIQKFKDIGFGVKSNEKKMAALIKEHPELAKEKIKILCDEGGLDLGDMRSLSQLDEEFEKIVKMSKKADVDPKSLRARWDKAVKKFNDSNAVTVAKNVTVVLTCAVLLHEFKTKIVQANKNYSEAKATSNKINAELYETLRGYNDPNFTNATGKAQCLLAMYREKKGLTEKALKRQASVVNRMTNAIVSFIDAATDSAVGRAVLGDVTGSFHRDKETQRQNNLRNENRELDRKRNEAQAQQEGRNRATHASNNP